MSHEKMDPLRPEPEDQQALVRTATKSLGPEGYGYGYRPYPDENAIDLRELWRIVRKHRRLIALLALVVTTIVAIEAFRTKTSYQSTAIVEVGRDAAATLVKTGDLIVQSDDTDNIKTRMLFITSRPLLEDVTVKLRLEENPRFMEVRERNSISQSLRAIADRLAAAGAGADETKQTTLPRSDQETLFKEAEDLMRPAEESARLAPFVKVLREGLLVEQIPDTRALNISFTHSDPLIAGSVANAVAAAFIERGFQDKTQKYTQTSEWLDNATRRLLRQVREAEQNLADYTRANNIFSTEGKGSLTTEKLVGLHAQVMKAETDRIIKQSLFEEVTGGRLEQLPEAFADQSTNELKKKLGELNVRLSEMNVKFGPENPKVIEVEQQIAALRQQLSTGHQSLAEKLKADYERAVRDHAALIGALERAKTEAARENQAAIQFNILRQNVGTANALYSDFLQKTNQANVQKAEQHNNLKLIEPAQVGLPVGPKRMRAIMIALFLSLVSGAGLAFFLEYLNNTVRTVEDVSRYTGLPTLAIVPVIQTAELRTLTGRKNSQSLNAGQDESSAISRVGAGQVINSVSRSAAAESYRVLRTSLLLSTAGHPPKKVLVTSAGPGEGKTTTIVNTAISLAQLGARVLLIDCDLRRPSAHKVFGASMTQGVTTFLSSDAPLEGLIQPTNIPNLSLMPCGPIPPNPAELLSSDRMKTMLELLARDYDHLLIDAPPLVNVADPLILSTLVEGVMLVVHGGKSTRDAVRRARTELAGAGARIFGVVLNRADLRREGYGDYYNYYYSDYSYDRKPEKEPV
jgi:capsular exopolysaccharide synthesis family protein